MKKEFKTKSGCTFIIEHINGHVGVTVRQPNGKSDLFACSLDDAKVIADLLKES
jgi:hypothetical protein